MGYKVFDGELGQALYESQTMTAFGLIHEDDNFDLWDFLEWLGKREYSENLYYEWLREVRAAADAEYE